MVEEWVVVVVVKGLWRKGVLIAITTVRQVVRLRVLLISVTQRTRFLHRWWCSMSKSVRNWCIKWMMKVEPVSRPVRTQLGRTGKTIIKLIPALLKRALGAA